jgi:hypothetical protein
MLFISCGAQDDNTKVEESTPLSTEDVTSEIEQLKKLNNDLHAAVPSATFGAGKMLYHAANEFVVNHPHHEKTPAVLELSAKGAEAMQQYQEAVNILDKLIVEFPATDETPNYMMNKARIIEERMQDIEKAKVAYADLIERFPDNQMSIDAKLYVDNFLGKEAWEVSNMLDSINAK